MTRKLTEAEKRDRKPASRACTFCHQKHLQCSNERPCKNCVKRGIADTCTNIERRKAKYLRQSPKPSSSNSVVQPLPNRFSQGVSQTVAQGIPDVSQNVATNVASTKVDLTHPINTTDEVLSKLFATEMKPSNSDYLDHIFDSNYLDQEYKMLGDIITNSKPTSPTPIPNPTADSTPSITMDTRPFISFGVLEDTSQSGTNTSPENVDLTSHLIGTNSGTYVSPLATHEVYKAVQDIYSNDVIYFDYPQLYHSLTFFLKKRFSGKNLHDSEKQAKRDRLLIILKLIASYRPTFISAHKSLYKPWDLQFLEMTFQRSLLDFERLSHLNSSPTIIWRRTGEIVSISKDLVSLLGWNVNEILSKRTFIMELMYDDDLIINYFKLFKSVAVGNLHSTIVTKCKLVKHDQGFMEFCSVWTVKRDIFDIPMLIMGQFLPILG